MCGPHFCSMKISQEVRDYAKQMGLDDDKVLAEGMAEKAKEFEAKGAQLYSKV